MRGRLSALAGADTVRARAFAQLDSRLTRDDPAPVALALSGGGDSLALLGLAASWCAHAGRPLLALTVDHGLAPASAGWTAFAGERARAAGAAWRALPWLGAKPASGLAVAARAARHALLAQAARAAGARVVLMGHTADDVAEGERMRLADAPGLGRLRAWGPSPVWPQGRGVALLRPLLDVSRAELRDWLRAQGQTSWIDDPANDDVGSPRIRARRATSPAPPGARAADPPPACAALALAGRVDAAGRLAWRAEEIRSAPPTVRARVLAAAAVCVGGGHRNPRGEPAEAFAEAAVRGGEVRTLAGARLATHGDEVVLTRSAPRSPPRVATLQQAAHVWDGRFEVTPDAVGWRMAPLAGHAARLPPADRRTLAGVAAAARPTLPVLLDAADAPRLPRPFGTGPAVASELVGARLRMAMGVVSTEAELARGASARTGDLPVA